MNQAKLDQLEAAYRDAAKKMQKKHPSEKDRDAYHKAADKFAKARSEWRAQEEQAGNRVGLVNVEPNGGGS
jgi:hypothetical protein